MAWSGSNLVAILILLVSNHVTAQTGPAYCTYSTDWFTCDYASMQAIDRPIDYTGFSIQPQQMKVNVNGYVPVSGESRTFTDTFANMDKSLFDDNLHSTLTMYCGWAGSVYISSGAFYNMSYVQSVKFQDCNVYSIPANGFEDFVDLDYLGFEYGTIDTVDPDAMAGLSVEKLTNDAHSIPRNMGKFELLYTKFNDQVVPPGLLFNWKNLTSATIKGADLTSITGDTFKYTTKLTHIDISDNMFTSIPSGIFDGLDSLAEVHLHNIQWDCTCDNLWFVEEAILNNITLYGDFVCSNEQGITAGKYWYDNNCGSTDVCGDTTGITIAGQCESVVGLCVFISTIVALLAAVSSLVLAIINLVNLDDMDGEPDERELRKQKREADRRSRELRYYWRRAARRIIKAIRHRTANQNNSYNMMPSPEQHEMTPVQEYPPPSFPYMNAPVHTYTRTQPVHSFSRQPPPFHTHQPELQNVAPYGMGQGFNENMQRPPVFFR